MQSNEDMGTMTILFGETCTLTILFWLGVRFVAGEPYESTLHSGGSLLHYQGCHQTPIACFPFRAHLIHMLHIVIHSL